MSEETESIPLSEVAERLKTTPLNVLMHIKRGLLTGEEVDGTWFVPVNSLNAYLEKEQEAGHGTLCKSHCQHGCSSDCG